MEDNSEFYSKPIALKPHQLWELLILVGLAAVLLLYLLLRSAGSFGYTLPQFDEVLESEIQSIRWSRNDGREYLLREDGGKWYIGDEKYPAKQSYVDSLVKQLSKPSLQDLVSQSGSLLTFGLDDEQAHQLEAFRADAQEPLRQLLVGKSSSSGRYSYVRLSSDQKQVYTLSENLSSILGKSIDDLRDRLVLNFSSSDIESLQILETATEKSIVVEKKEDKWQVPEGVAWNEDNINRLVNRFASMNAQAFIQNYPQTDAEYVIKFVAKGGVSYAVTVAASPLDGESDTGYAAKSSSYAFPFTLAAYTVEQMLQDFGFIAVESAESD